MRPKKKLKSDKQKLDLSELAHVAGGKKTTRKKATRKRATRKKTGGPAGSGPFVPPGLEIAPGQNDDDD